MKKVQNGREAKQRQEHALEELCEVRDWYWEQAMQISGANPEGMSRKGAADYARYQVAHFKLSDAIHMIDPGYDKKPESSPDPEEFTEEEKEGLYRKIEESKKE